MTQLMLDIEYIEPIETSEQGIGLTDDRLLHSRSVGEYCYRFAKDLLGWSEYKSREMFMMGLLHDVGYMFASKPNGHASIGGELLRQVGFNYWWEVSQHGSSDVNWVNHVELVILNTADMMTNAYGERVTFQGRLKDIASRHGIDSIQYKNCLKLTNKLTVTLESMGFSEDVLMTV